MVAAGRPKGARRGKSGLHRAGCRITSGGGDSKDSATEMNRQPLAGKGGRAVQETTAPLATEGAYVNPIRSKTETKHMAARQL